MISKFCLLFAVLSLSSAAFAGINVSLNPGDQNVNLPAGPAYTVSCSAAQQKCAVKNENGAFDVYAGPNYIAAYLDLDDALTAVKKLNSAGLCQ